MSAGLSVEELAKSTGRSPRLLLQLLEEERARGVVQEEGGRWRLTPRAERELGWALRALADWGEALVQ